MARLQRNHRRAWLVTILLMFGAAMLAGCSDDELSPYCVGEGTGAEPCCAPDCDQRERQPPGSMNVDASSPSNAIRDALPTDAMSQSSDAVVDPCYDVICDPGTRCLPQTGACVPRGFGAPGGGCTRDDDCSEDVCLPEEESGFIGGFCSRDCRAHADCDGGYCSDAAEGRVCLRACSATGGCREGWVCDEGGDAPLGACWPDCRISGCGGQSQCDAETGLCGRSPVACRYPCDRSEQCRNGRCLRPDGSCVTDYHCSLDEVCRAQRCEKAPWFVCLSSTDCSATQRCVAQGDGGFCAPRCDGDADCPLHRECAPDLQACLARECGRNVQNGAVFEGCRLGRADQFSGTCLPVEDGQNRVRLSCIEAGSSRIGEPCDAQSLGRTPDERAFQCEPGSLCYDDPDDPLEPTGELNGRGRCEAVCALDSAECPLDHQCVNLSGTTPPLALCLPSQCDVIEGIGSCGMDSQCQPYSLYSPYGRCGARGASLPGAACTAAEDCARSSLCVGAVDGSRCMTVCQRDAECPAGSCYREPTWALGVCLLD